MATVFSDNFDSDTVSVVPPNWTVNAADIVVSNTVARSGTKSCLDSVSSTMYPTGIQDGNSGDAQTTASFQFTVSKNGFSFATVLARMTTPSTSTAYTAYAATIGPAGGEILLTKQISGTFTIIADAGGGGSTFSLNVWYNLIIKCVGTTISGRLWRDSDGKYWDGAAWTNTTPVDFASVSDSDISGQGYAGVRLNTGATDLVYVDDFLFENFATISTAYMPPLALMS